MPACSAGAWVRFLSRVSPCEQPLGPFVVFGGTWGGSLRPRPPPTPAPWSCGVGQLPARPAGLPAGGRRARPSLHALPLPPAMSAEEGAGRGQGSPASPPAWPFPADLGVLRRLRNAAVGVSRGGRGTHTHTHDTASRWRGGGRPLRAVRNCEPSSGAALAPRPPELVYRQLTEQRRRLPFSGVAG